LLAPASLASVSLPPIASLWRFDIILNLSAPIPSFAPAPASTPASTLASTFAFASNKTPLDLNL